MSYATKADIITIYGRDYLSDLLPVDVAVENEVDEAVGEALASACAEIDSYLSTRYSLPLGGSPQALKRPAIDIASYILANRQSRITEQIEKRYEQAIDLLKNISTGKAGLGKDEPTIDTGSGSSQSGSDFSARPRKFGRNR